MNGRAAGAVIGCAAALIPCLVACCVPCLAGCSDDGGPRLAAVTPASARRGASVAISGSRLCGQPADCATAAGEVSLGENPPMVRAVVVEYSDTAAVIAVPQAAPTGRTVLIATVNERSSNALDFEVLP